MSSGPPPVPVIAFAHSAEAKLEFETSRRFDPSLKGWLAVVAIFAAASVCIALSLTRYWYIGVAIVAATVVLFLWPFARRGSPRR